MIKAVIFDLDGVLIDSEKQDFEAWKTVFPENELELNHDTYLSILGMKGGEIVKKYINKNVSNKDASKIVKQKERYFIDLIKKNKIKPINGVKILLRNLKKSGYKIGVGTSAPKYKVSTVLEVVGIEGFFDVVITDDIVSKGKPNPEVYLKAAENLEVKPEECVVIEDAPKGIRAAKDGGMKCIAITTTHRKEELSEADLIINSFKELSIKDIRNM